MADAIESVIGGLILMVGLAVLAVIYFLPSIVVLVRRSDTAGAVLVINLFLGWTFVGWVTSLAMAVSGTGSPRHAPSQVYPLPHSYRPVSQLQAYYPTAATTNGAGSGLNGHASAGEVPGS
jgi:Superinfection immunity protein